MYLSELRTIDSRPNEGANTLITGSLGWKRWFAGRGSKNKLALAGT